MLGIDVDRAVMKARCNSDRSKGLALELEPGPSRAASAADSLLTEALYGRPRATVTRSYVRYGAPPIRYDYQAGMVAIVPLTWQARRARFVAR